MKKKRFAFFNEREIKIILKEGCGGNRVEILQHRTFLKDEMTTFIATLSSTCQKQDSTPFLDFQTALVDIY